MKKYTFVILTLFALGILLASQAMAADTPEQVYTKINMAAKAKDMDTLLKYVTKEKREEFEKFTPAQQKQITEMMAATAPKDFKVIKKSINDENAVLNLEGTAMNPFTMKLGKAKGVLTFKKENGEWRLEKEQWNSEE